MLTTGIFESHRHEIPYKFGQEVSLIPFGDIHYGAPLHASETFEKYLKHWRSLGKSAWFIGMGDYTDLASTSERGKIRDLHESSIETLEQRGSRAITDELIEKLEFMRGRIIGLAEGNHYSVLGSGMTTTQYMCERLGCKYLGVMAFVRLTFNDNGARRALELCLHHGRGSGRRSGSCFNALEDLAKGHEADIYLMGHDHNLGAKPEQRVFMAPDGSIQSRQVYFIRTGSFLKGFEPGKPSYATDRCYNPLTLGAPEIKVKHIRKRIGAKSSIHTELRAVA